jgi:pimeloyl-ACP methyl ester carboxylesterase
MSDDPALAGLTRREFGVLMAGTLAAAASRGVGGDAHDQPARGGKGTGRGPILDIADWSYYWYGVEHALLARGTFCNGMQLFVEHWLPSEVRHPYPAVLIHGGYGQGSDWLSTPDGRRGWVSYLLEEGYKVYVVDRPGQGRNPYHPWVHGGFDAEAPTFERAAAAVRGVSSDAALHTQWPGSGEDSDPSIAQVLASLGQPMGNNPITQAVWQTRGVMLLEDIGPSMLMTHADGVLFAALAALARPDLVRGIVAVEPTGPSALGEAPAPARLAPVPAAIVTAEASASPDPVAAAAAWNDAGLRAEGIRLAERGIRGNGPMLMMEKNNREALRPVLDWLRSVELSAERGAPAMVAAGFDPNRNRESTALRLADQGGFFVGIRRKRMPYGTIAQGQMFVQYMIPAEQRSPYPVVLIHGGGGQGTHMMGLNRRPGWVHYFVQAGYAVYWLDRPSYGRSPYHPDALGPSHLPNVPPYEPLLGNAGVFNTGQWPGPGGLNDPFIDQFMACEAGNTTDEAFHSDLVWPGGVELLDRIGPCIIHGHAFGGFFGWGVADRRPALVKAIVCMEINGNPFERQLRWGLTAGPMTFEPPVSDPSQFRLVDRTPPPDSPRPVASPYKLQADPPHTWTNLRGIPIAWVTSEFGAGGSPVANVAFLRQVGCKVDMVRLRDHGIHGNGNLMLLEKNNHEVFMVIQEWLEKNVPAKS